MSDAPEKTGWVAFKGIEAYADTLAGVKAALMDVVDDINRKDVAYVAPLETKEAACRGGLKAQGQ